MAVLVIRIFARFLNLNYIAHSTMAAASLFQSLCLPSKVYFVLSVIAIIFSLMMGGVIAIHHLVHIVYVVFWTWVLNLICRAGYKWISWVLVLVPLIVVFLLLGVTLSLDDSVRYHSL